MTTERKPDASLEPSFAERVVEIEREIKDATDDPDWAYCDASDLSALLACIREQQAALEQWDKLIAHQYAGSRIAMSELQAAAIRGADVLARWRIEK